MSAVRASLLNVWIGQILAKHFGKCVGHVGYKILVVGYRHDIPGNMSLVPGCAVHERHGKVGGSYAPVLFVGKVNKFIGNFQEGFRIEMSGLVLRSAFLPALLP